MLCNEDVAYRDKSYSYLTTVDFLYEDLPHEQAYFYACFENKMFFC